MALHMNLGHKNTKTGHWEPALNMRFEDPEVAKAWFDHTELRVDGDVHDLIDHAASGQEYAYVQCELQVMRVGGGYTDMFLCVEGEFGKETYDDRLPDIEAKKVQYHTGPDNKVFRIDYYGEDLDGDKKLWGSIHIRHAKVEVVPVS